MKLANAIALFSFLGLSLSALAIDLSPKTLSDKVCNGSEPRHNPTFSATYTPETIKPGVPLDVAARNKQDGIASARSKLQKYVWDAQEGPLSALVDNFTFRLPGQVVCKIQHGMYPCNESRLPHNWGYDHGKFSPKDAIEYRERMWEEVFLSQTVIKEAAQEDGSLRLELTVSMELFCKYGVAAKDLVSQ